MILKPNDNELHRIAVTGIIWKLDPDGKRRYLITKRAPHKKVLPNKWTVPGGGMEATDYTSAEPTFESEQSPQWVGAAERTLRREIREEVNLEVDDINYLLDIAFIRPDAVAVLVLSFYCAYMSGEVELDQDTTDFAWVTVDELGAYDFIVGIDEEIKKADTRLTTQH